MMAMIKTAQGRQEAKPEFLNCCRILTHHNPTMVLVDATTGKPSATPANLFPRQPSQHFLRDVLGSPTSSPTGYTPQLLQLRGCIVISPRHSRQVGLC
jgi:hypothetical protein